MVRRPRPGVQLTGADTSEHLIADHDRAISFAPMAAENWPESPWPTPWRRAEAAYGSQRA